MFLDDPYGCFDEHPEHKAEQSLLRLTVPFVAEVIERLLHGLPQPLPECWWIEAKEFLVESTNCFLVKRHTQKL